jgi:hypothetical protein
MSDVKKKERPFLGRAIVDGKIRYTSVSQIKLFDPSSEGCPRKWHYAYKQAKKLARTGSQTGGSDFAEKLEHFETTGEDVLPPVLQPAKKFFPVPGADLECEKPLGDIEKAVGLRDAFLKRPPGAWPQLLIAEIQKFAGLTAANVPVDGAADVRHIRGEFIDSDGILKREPAGAVVAEIVDLKTTSRIFPQKILSGPNAGTMIQSYVKTDAEVCADVQMIGYGRHAVDLYPGLTHVRLSHVYANTTKREAVKRTGIISVEQVLRRWEPVENVVREMETVATIDRVEDVLANTSACDSYTHVDPNDPTGKKVLKGCGHRYYCPLHITQVVNNMLSPYKESAMSLFDHVPGAITPPAVPTAVAPPPPPLDDAAHAAAVALERDRLLAQMSATPVAPPVPVASTAPAAPMASLDEAKATLVRFKDGTLQYDKEVGRVISRESDGGLKFRVATAAEKAGYLLWESLGFPKDVASDTVVPAPAVPTRDVAPSTPTLPISVSPPDAPPAPSLLDAAAALPPEEIALIVDPALKARVEEHARQHAERALEEAAMEEAAKVAAGTSVWCPGGSQKIAVTSDIAVGGYTCQCGKHWSLKALKATKEGEQYVADIARHKPVKKEGSEELTAAAVPAVPAAPAVSVAVASSVTAPVVPIAPAVPAAPVIPAAPLAVAPLPPTVHTNGHAKNGAVEHTTSSTVQVRANVMFRVTLGSRKAISVIAPTMAVALVLAEGYVAQVGDSVLGIETLVGDVVEGR